MVCVQGRSVVVRCPAKLNLFLEVVGRRDDGYHDIDTVMQAIDLADVLEIAPRADGELVLVCSDPGLPTDERNLVVRAAVALREATGHGGGATMRLTKRVPSEAGLGGGSSDAAGALVGLSMAWGLGLGAEELRPVAAGVGSDVAFFLTGGTARCTGRGEVVEPLEVGAVFHYVLVCPQVRVSTGAAYEEVRFPLTPRRNDINMMVRSVVEGHVGGVGGALFNRLEGPAFSLHPELSAAKGELARSGPFAGVGMTGSGSALFGLCQAGQWELAGRRAAELRLGDTRRVQSVGHGVTAQWVP